MKKAQQNLREWVKCKLLIFLISITFSQFSLGQTTIWSEDFSGYTNGTTTGANNNTANGAADWTTSCATCSGDEFGARSGGVFRVRNTDENATWTSEAIDISAYTNISVTINVDADDNQLDASDCINFFYNTGSGNTSFTMNGSICDDNNGTTVASVAGLSGASLVLSFVAITNNTNEDINVLDITVEGTLAPSITYGPCDFDFRKTIAVDPANVYGGADLTNFPMLVSITDADLSSGTGHVTDANGYDIVFYDRATCTFVDFQVEKYTAATGELVVWIEVPTLSATEVTEIDMLYGNDAITTDQSSTGTWDADFTSVYHLSDGDYSDFTSNTYDGTGVGVADRANGKVAGAQTFGPVLGNSDRITIPSGNLSAAAGTIEFWVRQDAFSPNEQYLYGHTSLPAYANRIQIYSDDAAGNLDIGLGNNHTVDTDVLTMNTNEWYHFVLTWNGTNYDFFVNGNSVSSGAYAGLTTLNTESDLGNNGNSADRTQGGRGSLDEFRISSAVRSDGWIQTSYASQNDPSSFYTISANETYACDTLYSIQTGDWDIPGTWSLSSGGCSCACIPKGTDSSTVFIEGGYTVTLTGADEIGYMVIGTSTGAGAGAGALEWGGGFDLDIYGTSGGIDIRSNGSLDRNGNAGWSLDFDNTSGANYTWNNDGYADIHEFDIGDATLTISGSADIRVRDDVNFRADNSVITNNNTAEVSVEDDFDFNNFTATINNNGTFDIDGGFTDVQAGEVIYYNFAGSVTNFAGLANDTDTDMQIDADYDSNTFEYDRNGETQRIIVSHGYWNLTLSNSGNKNIDDELLDVNGNLTIEDDAQLNADDEDDDISLAGNWINTSTHGFNSGTQSITFDGSSAQEITCNNIAGGEIFYDLIINNVNDEVTLNDPVSVTGTLTMTAGNIVTNATDLLVIEDGASSSIGSDDSFVDGPMKKVGDDDNFVFPVGDGGTWAAMGMIGIANFDATTEFTCEYFFSAAPNPRNLAPGISHVSGIEYWTLERTVDPGTDASLQVRLYWDSEAESEITDLTDHNVGHYTTQWIDEGGTVVDNGTDGYVTSGVVNTFSPFTFISNTSENSLPVELISFEADVIEHHSLLTWYTASEENNSHFVVQRSTNGLSNWESIGRVEGSGNTNNLISYSYIDLAPYKGHNYYRLIQVDYDGTETLTSVDWVLFNVEDQLDYVVFPNPTNNTLNVQFQHEYEGNIAIQLMDMKGRVLREIKETHTLSEKISMWNLPQATYILKILYTDKVFVEKVVKH